MVDGFKAFAPINIAEENNLAQGGRDFVHVEHKNIIFVAISEMKIASRLDSYLTNVSKEQVNSFMFL